MAPAMPGGQDRGVQRIAAATQQLKRRRRQCSSRHRPRGEGGL